MANERTRARFIILTVVAVAFMSGAMWLGRGGGKTRNRGGALPAEIETPPELSGPDIAPAFMFPPGAEGGGIEGRVLDPAGKPVAGAVVSIGPRLVGRAKFREWLKRARPRMVRSDDSGVYRVDDVRPGVLALSASAAPFLAGRREPVKLMPGERLTGVDIKLETGGVRLHGRVSDSGGGPIAGALVTVAAFDWHNADDDSSVIVVQGVAGDDGRYELYLEPLWYDIRVSADGYAPDQSWAQVKVETRHDVKLHPAARITGFVRDDQGNPVADARVRVVPTMFYGPGQDDERRTDAEGRYQSQALDPGKYNVEARFGALAVRTGEPVAVGLAETVTVDLVLRPGYLVSGRVTDSRGKPITGARIHTDAQIFFGAGGDRVDVRSDGDGFYEIKGLLGPMLRLNCEADGHGQQTWMERTLKGDRKDVNFTLPAGGRLTIQVLDPDGRPVKGAMAAAQVGDRRDFEHMVMRETDKASGEDGKVVIAGLPPGKAEVHVHAMEFGSQRQENVEIVAGQDKALTVRFQIIASLAGVVSFDDGRPAAGVQVFAVGRTGGNGTTSREDGSFEIEKLAPGDYTVMAQDKNQDEFFIKQRPDARSQAQVGLKAGDRRDGIKLTLQSRALTIGGMVVDPGGRPVPGAQVGVTTTNGAKFGDCAMAYRGKVLSDDGGRFEIENLPKGVYGICATAAGFPNAIVENVPAGTQDLRVRLRAPGRIAGMVVDAAGKPVATGTVTAAQRPSEEDGSSFAPFKTAPKRQDLAGTAGAFSFEGLRPGVYDVMANAGDGGRGLARGLRVDEGAEVKGVRVQLQAGISLTGRLVHAETRQPLARVKVTAWSLDMNTTTDAEGRFRLNNVPAGIKVALFCEPPAEAAASNDSLEAWVPADGKDHLDIGTFSLPPGKQDEAPWTARASTGLRVRHEGGHPVVTGIYEESPAANVGIKVRDRVLSINGKSIAEMGATAIDKLLEGEEGRSVKVQVQSGDAPAREVTIGLARF